MRLRVLIRRRPTGLGFTRRGQPLIDIRLGARHPGLGAREVDQDLLRLHDLDIHHGPAGHGNPAAVLAGHRLTGSCRKRVWLTVAWSAPEPLVPVVPVAPSAKTGAASSSASTVERMIFFISIWF